MVRCQYCGKEVYLYFRCKYCGGYFCVKHHLPENHDCPGLKLYKAMRKKGRLFELPYPTRELIKKKRKVKEQEVPVRTRRQEKIYVSSRGARSELFWFALFLYMVSLFLPWFEAQLGDLGKYTLSMVDFFMYGGPKALLYLTWDGLIFSLVSGLLVVLTVAFSLVSGAVSAVLGTLATFSWYITLSKLREALGFAAAFIGIGPGIGLLVWYGGVVISGYASRVEKEPLRGKWGILLIVLALAVFGVLVHPYLKVLGIFKHYDSIDAILKEPEKWVNKWVRLRGKVVYGVYPRGAKTFQYVLEDLKSGKKIYLETKRPLISGAIYVIEGRVKVLAPPIAIGKPSITVYVIVEKAKMLD
ncbi:MAG: hypothetical protein DRN53_04190 [Thermoprotei archaeon]|nr:MAG: hypothetical protein DRN53_04190 [Thermoprotei archaeon]